MTTKAATRLSRILLWLTAVGAAAALAAGCGYPTSLAGSTAGGGAVTAAISDGPYTLLQEPQAGYGAITQLITHATTSVAITMYELADRDVEQALIDARSRGVAVTVVLDAAWHGRTVNQAAYDRLTAAGLNITWAPAGTIVHEKAIVIDDSTAIVSTANLQSRYYTTSRDALIKTTDPTAVSAIGATIHGDFAAAGTGRLSQARPAPSLIWSPAARAAFIQTITAAQHSVDLTSEEFKDRAVQIAVTHAVQRGVACRMVLNSDAATTAAVSAVEQAGCSVHVLPKSVTGLYMHEKAIITDAQTPAQATLVIGSQNISTRSLTQNRELSIKLDSRAAPNIVAACEAQFAEDYNKTSAAKP